MNLGKKHLDRQNWENLMQSERTGHHFKWTKKNIRKKQCKGFVVLTALPCFHSHFYANIHASVTLLFLFAFLV